MLIKDIKYPRVKKLAKKLAKESATKRFFNPELLGGAFSWGSGDNFDFWDYIDDGNYEKAYSLKPELFKPTKKEVKQAYKIYRKLKDTKVVYCIIVF